MSWGRPGGADGDGGGSGVAGSARLSVTLTSPSTPDSDAQDPFNESNHADFGQIPNIPAVGITYTPANGRCTITEAGVVDGIYRISVQLVMASASNGSNADWDILVNDTPVYTRAEQVHSLIDNTSVEMEIYRELSTDDFVNIEFDNAGAFDLNTEAGTTINIERIG